MSRTGLPRATETAMGGTRARVLTREAGER